KKKKKKNTDLEAPRTNVVDGAPWGRPRRASPPALPAPLPSTAFHQLAHVYILITEYHDSLDYAASVVTD
ncbi:hypothetical protein, partial [Burkholderia sp. Tr-20390]|uniref:hypothetical protein n=1 Tax=Burkholderia sp. Tr-20390 TaxID=2703904 RepID=UPI00197D3B6C